MNLIKFLLKFYNPKWRLEVEDILDKSSIYIHDTLNGNYLNATLSNGANLKSRIDKFPIKYPKAYKKHEESLKDAFAVAREGVDKVMAIRAKHILSLETPYLNNLYKDNDDE